MKLEVDNVEIEKILRFYPDLSGCVFRGFWRGGVGWGGGGLIELKRGAH